MIYIFGSEKCEHCITQKKIMESSFDNDQWQYVDVLKEPEAFEIAVSMDVIGFPTIIATNDKNEILLHNTGLISADHIFQSLYKQSIPISNNDKNKFFSGSMKKIYLASYPDLSHNTPVDVRLYNGEKIGECKIKNITKEIVAGNNKITIVQKQNYLNRGGRQDYTFAVEVERV